jgi:hypothetical protein
MHVLPPLPPHQDAPIVLDSDEDVCEAAAPQTTSTEPTAGAGANGRAARRAAANGQPVPPGQLYAVSHGTQQTAAAPVDAHSQGPNLNNATASKQTSG